MPRKAPPAQKTRLPRRVDRVGKKIVTVFLADPEWRALKQRALDETTTLDALIREGIAHVLARARRS